MVSVIIPVYKVEEYLDDCVESVCRQTCQDIEIILVDDGSPDRCPEMCEAWKSRDPRIRVIHRENGGLSAARNTGLYASKGDYILYVDSDDTIAEDMVEVLLKTAEANGADIAFSTLSTEEIHKKAPEAVPMVMEAAEMLVYVSEKGYWHSWAKLIRRSVAVECPFVEKLIYEDYENTPRLFLKAGRAALLEDGRYFYRLRENSIMGSERKTVRKDFFLITESNLRLIASQDIKTEIRDRLNAAMFFNLLQKYHILSLGDGLFGNRQYWRMTREFFLQWEDTWRHCPAVSRGKRIRYDLFIYTPKLYHLVYAAVRWLKKKR